MSDQTVNQNDLAKALGDLQDLAKGHSSRGTNTTDVPSMRDASVGAGSGGGSTQVFHTQQNSDPQGWAGSKATREADDGTGPDGISENGTDVETILSKLSKGHALTAAEYAIVKGMACKDDKEEEVAKAAPPFAKKGEEEDGKDPKKDKEEEMGKSLSDFADDESAVSRGLEVSEFLAGFANVVEKSLNTMEERIVSRLTGELGSTSAESGEFQKSLAGAIAGLGETLAAVVQRVDQVEGQAARPPKSVQGVQAIEKGGFAGPTDGEPLNKALVGNALVQLVQENKAQVNDVVKFESTGQLSQQLETAVRGMLGSGR